MSGARNKGRMVCVVGGSALTELSRDVRLSNIAGTDHQCYQSVRSCFVTFRSAAPTNPIRQMKHNLFSVLLFQRAVLWNPALVKHRGPSERERQRIQVSGQGELEVHLFYWHRDCAAAAAVCCSLDSVARHPAGTACEKF